MTALSLLLAGLLVLGFIVWQFFIKSSAVAQEHDFVAHNLKFQAPAVSQQCMTDYPEHQQVFGTVEIPRFGQDYLKPLVEGHDQETLDTLGIGHYAGSTLPGCLGNVALAGHRQTGGQVFDRIEELQPGDDIIVNTTNGKYTYKVFRTFVTSPDDVSVVDTDPLDPGTEPEKSLLTITTCHPWWSDTERYVVQAEMSSWEPRLAGS